MKINLLAFGTHLPAWVNEGYQEYSKRLSQDIRLNLVELEIPKRTKSSDIQKLKLEESEKLLSKIPTGNRVVALDEHGDVWDTKTLASKLQTWLQESQDISLLVGGPDGLAKPCLEKANHLWSLSRLTFPHGLVRVIIAEQIYRAWSVIKQHPYHRT
ncbi:MAG: 23S rRNA (pseudouridine(1915)-N(3))-methyltransferase RlmH [Proteobacteria bacterium]|nr:23S rRNA (pseudouridine(1915)-N(3))-methyltransferase RlmH [Pseudomonadota bacterium]